MSSLLFDPEAVGAAAQHLTEIGSAVNSANSAAAASTTQVATAAHDEVSVAVAGVFDAYGKQYQALVLLANRFHDQFVRGMRAGAAAYAAAETSNAATLRGIDTRIAPIAADARSAGIANLLRIQEFINELSMYIETASNIIQGEIELIRQLLRNL